MPVHLHMLKEFPQIIHPWPLGSNVSPRSRKSASLTPTKPSELLPASLPIDTDQRRSKAQKSCQTVHVQDVGGKV